MKIYATGVHNDILNKIVGKELWIEGSLEPDDEPVYTWIQIAEIDTYDESCYIHFVDNCIIRCFWCPINNISLKFPYNIITTDELSELTL